MKTAKNILPLYTDIQPVDCIFIILNVQWVNISSHCNFAFKYYREKWLFCSFWWILSPILNCFYVFYFNCKVLPIWADNLLRDMQAWIFSVWFIAEVTLWERLLYHKVLRKIRLNFSNMESKFLYHILQVNIGGQAYHLRNKCLNTEEIYSVVKLLKMISQVKLICK